MHNIMCPTVYLFRAYLDIIFYSYNIPIVQPFPSAYDCVCIWLSSACDIIKSVILPIFSNIYGGLYEPYLKLS